MKLNFLCNSHRENLILEPDKAIRSCNNMREIGFELINQQRYKEAVSYLGCAMEVAEILIIGRELDGREAIDWYLQATTGLSCSLKKLSRLDECKEVYKSVINRLSNELKFSQTMASELKAQISCMRLELMSLEDECLREEQFLQPVTFEKSSMTVLH